MSVNGVSPYEREQLILAHLPQVHLLAKRLHRRSSSWVEFDDLFSCGVLGLIQAVDRFQPERGYQLKTFAEYRIRGAMADYLRKLDPLSSSARRFVRAREEMNVSLTAQLGRPPQEAELAQALGLSIERYRRSLSRVVKIVSLEAVRHSSGSIRY